MHLEDCREFLMNTARRLLAADSPSGFTQQAAAVVEQIAEELGPPWTGNTAASTPGTGGCIPAPSSPSLRRRTYSTTC